VREIFFVANIAILNIKLHHVLG